MYSQLPYSYGGASGIAADSDLSGAPFAKKSKSVINPRALVLCFLLPWTFYAILSGALSFTMHYQTPGLCDALVKLCLLLVLASGGFVAWTSVKRNASASPQASFNPLMFVSILVAYFVGVSVGNDNYENNMRPYYDLIAMNSYSSVNTLNTTGNQLMDMGRITFSSDSYLDLSRSSGFRNSDYYCVAPIVGTSNKTQQETDFWAIGRNCCSGKGPDFKCGEYNRPSARSGLRLMDDEVRPFYRLAVEQAAATYNMKASNPIFVYWMEDPMIELHAYEEVGTNHYIFGLVMYFVFQLFAVTFVAAVFTKYM